MKGGLLLACALGALALAGCGGSHHAYPANIQTNFLNACEADGGDVSSCGCALKWFESHKTLTQFEADEDQMRSGGTPSDVLKAISSCSNA